MIIDHLSPGTKIWLVVSLMEWRSGHVLEVHDRNHILVKVGSGVTMVVNPTHLRLG
jgi:hypothetical protein